MSLAERLTKARALSGLSQAEVAEAIGMGTKMAWSMVERGIHHLPATYFVSVSRLLGIPIPELIELTLNEERKRIMNKIAQGRVRKNAA